MSELVHLTDDFDAALEYGAAIARLTLDRFGQRAVQECRRDCPVSDIDTEGYVHMIDTIGYDVQEGDGDIGYVEVYVDKPYASYVNFGTSRMGARPFFTNGMQRAEDAIADIAGDLAVAGNLSVTSEAALLADRDPQWAAGPGGNVMVEPEGAKGPNAASGGSEAQPGGPRALARSAESPGSPLRAARGRTPGTRGSQGRSEGRERRGSTL